MRTVNQVILIGNIVKDPLVKEITGGQKMAMFTIATNRNWFNKNGERQTSTEFHNCVAWSKVADLVHKYVKKSKLVYATGYLKTREYIDESTRKKTFRTEVVVLDLILLDKRSKNNITKEEIDIEQSINSSGIEMDGIDI